MPYKGGFPTPISYIILGVVALAAYPQFAGVTDEAMVNTLSTNLNVVRRAVEIYFVQHDNKYPDETTAADGINNTDITRTSLLQRLAKLGMLYANDEVSLADDDKPHKQY